GRDPDRRGGNLPVVPGGGERRPAGCGVRADFRVPGHLGGDPRGEDEVGLGLTVSVELRTPLTSIYGFAQTLLREDVAFGEAERRIFRRFIAHESERRTSIGDALLNVARLGTGDLTVGVGTGDVASVVGCGLSA